MSQRHIHARYRDPVDEIWVNCAEKIGFRVERSQEVFASSDGSGTLSLAVEAELDPDDSLAQLILHELCHSLVEGPEALEKPDWDLDNTSERDVPREWACQRLQAFLAKRYGLERLLASTTSFREYYDSVLENPLEPRTLTSTSAAIRGLARVTQKPWGPHLEHALQATSQIALAHRSATPPSKSMWWGNEPAAAHPIGGFRAGASSCADCTWAYTGGPGRPVMRCRNHGGARIEGEWPSCEAFERDFDCQECGACCREAYHSVTVSARDLVIKRHPELVVDRGTYLELRRTGERCAALQGGELEDRHNEASRFQPFRCSIYENRPKPCRELENAGKHCLTARRRVGLSL